MKHHQIKWYRCKTQVSEESINYVKGTIPYRVPDVFFELMSKCDSGIPLNTDFEYYDGFYKAIIPQALGCFLGIEDDEYNFLYTYKNPPEFFPSKLLAFAETGNGDLICFDYRKDPNNIDPPIVFWNHEADEGRDVSFVANSFDEFLGMLKEPEEI